ncbi:MAG: nucleotidyl transferase AbiEii/AbiGii toxin family protein [Limisphaerales bacterium]
MNKVFAAASDLQGFCEKADWKFCFIGGVAVQRWGKPRFTADADLTLLTGFGHEERFAEALLKRFLPRRANALEFALQYRVLLLQTAEGVPLDIAFGGLPFEENSIRRASPFEFPTGRSLLTCSAEDLIVHKTFAARDIDWFDVDGILARQWGKLDLDLVRRELKPLVDLQGRPESLARLEQKIREHACPFTTIPLPPEG